MIGMSFVPIAKTPLYSSHVRWRIFSFLFGFGFIAYFQQKSLTIVADQMMPQLHLSQLQIGWLEQAFVIGYALFQLPGGIFGQRFGARLGFTIIGLAAFFATIATPLAPVLLNGQGLFLALLCVQLFLGVAQGAIFPISAGVFEAWFPPERWSFIQGLQSMGLGLGAALTAPLIATLMLKVGWQRSLLWTSIPALLVIAGWAWYGRNTPREHRRVSPAELATIGDRSQEQVTGAITLKRVWASITNRNVFLLAISYVSMNYAYYLLSNWVFLYLVQERHFSLLESGWLATTPPLAAGLGAGVGGVLTGVLCKRFGLRWGYRWVPLLSLPSAGVFLLMGVNADNPYLAVLALACSFFCIELTEGSYWGTVMSVAKGDTMIAGGVMNTGGNLGGIIGIPIVAYLSGQHEWHAAFLIGAAAAILSAVAWLGINAE